MRQTAIPRIRPILASAVLGLALLGQPCLAAPRIPAAALAPATSLSCPPYAGDDVNSLCGQRPPCGCARRPDPCADRPWRCRIEAAPEPGIRP